MTEPLQRLQAFGEFDVRGNNDLQLCAISSTGTSLVNETLVDRETDFQLHFCTFQESVLLDVMRFDNFKLLGDCST